MRRRLLYFALSGLVAALAGGGWVAAGLPSRAAVRGLARKGPGETALMLQREAEAGNEKSQGRAAWVPLSRISRHLLHAVLASEDQRFLAHEGVDWAAVRESVEDNVKRRRLWRGGSTLTQQLAKNLYFGTSRTPVRKARELVVTSWLEADLSKPRILALYLNVIEWGEGLYGCQAAAGYWFDTPASALSVQQAAGLAAMIPKSPNHQPGGGPPVVRALPTEGARPHGALQLHRKGRGEPRCRPTSDGPIRCGRVPRRHERPSQLVFRRRDPAHTRHAWLGEHPGGGCTISS